MLPAETFAAPSVLPGWDVRTLLGHIVGSKAGLSERIGTRSDGAAQPAAQYVRAYAPAAADITAQTVAITGEQQPDQLIEALREPISFVPGE